MVRFNKVKGEEKLFLLFVRFVYIKNKNLCIYLSQMITVKVLHHTLLSPPSIWGHHQWWWFIIIIINIIFRTVSALDPNRFDVTLESFLFGMCWSYVVPQLCFAPERLVTQIARGFNFCVDITIVVIEKGFTWKFLTTKVAQVQNSFFLKYASFCCY